MLEKIFDPQSFGQKFSFDAEAAVRRSGGEPFMILLPPPNVTGSLHIGHALCYTLQDVLARYKRLRGCDVLFQPGLDHAGIVTQLLVEKQLQEQGVERKNLAREEFLNEVWRWKENSGGLILEQMKVLGVSCDFSRLRFTMDDGGRRAVTKMFVGLFRDGLIYREKKMVNWDPRIGSAISDLEVVEKEVEGHLWRLKYPLEDGSGSITVATTRPETMFGDVAVAVNPNDVRYRRLVGKNVVVPLAGRVVPIIADEYADMEKGTGAVKITPAHDFNDFDVGQRHSLPIIDVMDGLCRLNDAVPEAFRWMDRFEARKKVVETLENAGLVEKVEAIKQTIPFGDRSGVVLEPKITYQWFVDAKKLSIPAIEAVQDGRVKFIPKHWENLYFEWLNNIRPWCISRQIWWGHRIPAWYGPDGHIFVEENSENAQKAAAEFYGTDGMTLVQDEDVLDTWFSSGMWPFVTLGWPDETPDMARYYSKCIIVTGFDIIFFWVARMIMMGVHANGAVPFSHIYIHGLVRDEKGQKMSKSKKNVIDPLELCRQYGADAVRYTIASMASPGRNIKMNSRLVEGGRNFLTKLWNVVRFAQMHRCVFDPRFDVGSVTSPIARWIVSSVGKMLEDLEQSIENYRFDEAVRHVHRCIWNSFCDWYMEFIKPILQGPPSAESRELANTSAWAILQFTRVLYPIAPFIAKELSLELGVEDIQWPDQVKISDDWEESIGTVEFLKNVIASVRSTRQYLQIPVGERLSIWLEAAGPGRQEFLERHGEILRRMAGVVVENTTGGDVAIAIDGAVLHIGVGGKINVGEERKRLTAESSELAKFRREAAARLENDDFLRKASEEVILEHRERIVHLDEKIENIGRILRSLED
jgi:valyl-tRNA synthetase